MICRNGLLIFVFFLSSSLALSQNDLIPKLNSLARDFVNSIGQDDQEKIFVQTDKSFYTSGEDIWLRAYCVETVSHKILQRSKSLFVDLVNDQDSLVSQIMLNNGLLKLDGCISLPANLAEGFYWLRAYTRRMLREDSLAVYVQPLYVSNPANRNTRPVKHEEDSIIHNSDTSQIAVRFYPEGGTVIAGISTKFVFTAYDQSKKPLEVFGYVTDSSNVVVAKYGTTLPGMGSFSLFTDGSMKYTAHSITGQGKVLATTLPGADPYAYQLSVTGQSADSIFVQVSLGDSVYKKYKPSFILGVSRDSLCYTAVGKDMYTFSIDKKNFPEGRASLLLFNVEQKMVSQRDLYINRESSGLAIVPDRASYGPRQKVKLTVMTGHVEDNQIPPSVLSISVTDNRAENKNIEPGVLNRIKNDNIEFPFSYLKDSDSRSYTAAQWDLIMLTQEANYLGWQKSMDINFASGSQEESDTEVTNLTGRILSKKNLPIKNRIIALVSNSRENIFEKDTTDESGRFYFLLPDNILDSTRLAFQVSNAKGWQMEDSIAIDPMNFPRFSTPPVLKKRFSMLQTKQLEDFKHDQMDSFIVGKRNGWLTLKPVTIARPKKAPATYDESKIVSLFSKIIPGDKIGLNQSSIETAILSVPGVSFQGGRVIIRGGGIPGAQGGVEPLLYVDGFQVPLISFCVTCSPLLSTLQSYNPRTIDFIEVLEGADASIYGPGSDRGVVFVHTTNSFRADPADEKKGLKVFYARGYYMAPSFQEPDYDKTEIRYSPYPDQRSTIFWNGNIVPDDHGKAMLQFYTADPPTNYIVSIVGLTAGGEVLFAKSKIIRE